MSHVILNAQSLATLAFNLPGFLNDAEGDAANIASASACFLDDASDKWTAHTGMTPTSAVLASATVLLIGMATHALAIRAEDDARAAWDRAANDNRCNLYSEYETERHGVWCM